MKDSDVSCVAKVQRRQLLHPNLDGTRTQIKLRGHSSTTASHRTRLIPVEDLSGDHASRVSGRKLLTPAIPTRLFDLG